MSSHESEQLEEDIKTVVWNASNQIQSTDQRTAIAANIPVAFALLLVTPLLGLLLQVVRYYGGFQATAIFPLYAWLSLTVAVPIGWLFYKAATLKLSIDRQRALLAADKQIGAAERITTADEFMRKPAPDGFMKAAVDDASQWARQGREAKLERTTTSRSESRIPWIAVPASMVLIGLVFFVGQYTRPTVIVDAGSPEKKAVVIDVGNATEARPEAQIEDPTEDETDEEQKETPKTPRKQRAVNRQGDANAAIPDNAEESDGKLNEGETRESQQSSNPSSARGAPSASGQPSKSDDKQKPRKKKKKKSKPEREREKKERKEDEKPSGASAGQGSSKGSDNNAAPSDWASTSQAATPEDENVEEEDDVDDEEEEQESRGGVQPNMRDRRTPVNRDLQIGFGNARPNPDANGRGGPSGQKKSRGVASLVLGVPIPDRVNGQPNKGRIRITQQRITPEIEESDQVAAQDRTTMNGHVGPIHHPELEPWLQNLVRRYFLDQREKAPLSMPEKDSETVNSDDSLQTSNVAESDSPQS
ncbi:hypothetical protein N9F76_00940 [bacterium]|nr:hypothetical protein [bacterium]